ncbi:transglutaminase domain-containing protein [Sulfurovum sp. bin170]|uniref:transglutaminase-like domain-containing protein n=1 Tax=Sulfurovum sp. bin170 TaxID=2695268 RepID=UPI0013DE9CAE|nr:transglutaminase domain-containing protein [Sulfurovum sp. bin170]NEW61346.1 transglutaminase domain-containing protein [Sulfurovum sp. bin170]
MQSKLSTILSKVIIGSFGLYFLYIFISALFIVDRRHIGTEDGTYINSTTDDPYIKKLAHDLTQKCSSNLCKVQNILNYVTHIPYKINYFSANSPQETIQKNFGDCDDKSNLLISLLHELDIESYFVLVPKHIFVIVALDEVHLNRFVEGLYINGRKYYILESTAKGSAIGFPLNYKLSEISNIIEPFENRKLDIGELEWRL